MVIHSVYFWLSDGLSGEDVEAFRKGLESLRPVETVATIYIGTPARTEPRPVIDASYDFSLIVLFQSVEAHNLYQTHPLHEAFVRDCKKYWKKVQIYDTEVPVLA